MRVVPTLQLKPSHFATTGFTLLAVRCGPLTRAHSICRPLTWSKPLQTPDSFWNSIECRAEIHGEPCITIVAYFVGVGECGAKVHVRIIIHFCLSCEEDVHVPFTIILCRNESRSECQSRIIQRPEGRNSEYR